MNYKDKYIKYKSKYLLLQNQIGGTKESSIASAATFLPTKPKSVLTQDQGQNSTCWAHGYARSFVRTLQILCIVTDDKVEQWYELFYAILIQRTNCDEGGYFNNMVYLFNYLKDDIINNINTIFTITKEKIKCVSYECSLENKDIKILQLTEIEITEIKQKLKFVFDNKLIFLAIYPYAVNPDTLNYPTKAIQNMLDLRLQPFLSSINWSRSLYDFLSKKKTETYDLFQTNYLFLDTDISTACTQHMNHLVVLRTWMKDKIEIKNSWGPNKNFTIDNLKDITCTDGDFLSNSIIEIGGVMIDYKKLELHEYMELKIKVDNKIKKYKTTIDPRLRIIKHNHICDEDNYGFPHGENCELKDYQHETFFKGKLIHGIKNGYGENTYTNGDVYEGNWKDNTINGQGKYTYKNGDVYEGNWKDYKRHGYGIEIILNNGLKYEGLWKDNKKHGTGKFTFPTGKFFTGNWENDKIINIIELS